MICRIRQTPRPGGVSFVATALLSAVLVLGCAPQDEAELIRQARSALSDGQYKTAEIHLKNLLQNADSHAEGRSLLGRAYLLQRDWAGAEKELRRALELGTDAGEILPGLLEAMLHTAGPQAVIEQAGQPAAHPPEAAARIHFWVGRAWMKLGDADRADASFQAALAADPSLLVARIGSLSVQARGGGEARSAALAAVDALLKEAPTSHEALMLQAELRHTAGDLAGARESLQAAIAQSPTELLPRLMLVEIDLGTDDREAARTHLAALLKLAPAWAPALALSAQLALREGKAEAARDSALQALKGAPEYPPALANASAALLALGALEQAELHARQLIKVAPQSSGGYRLLAMTLLRRGAAGRALEVLEPIVRSESADSGLLVLAGEAALRDGNTADSSKYFALASARDKENPSSRVGLALAKLGSGDQAGALSELEAAADLPGKSSHADQVLIAALVNARQFDRAEQSVTRLEKKQPGSAEVPLWRGRIALARGDAAKARTLFERSLAIAPTLMPAVTSLASLDMRDGEFDRARQRFQAVVTAEPQNVSALLALARLTAQAGGAATEVEALARRARAANADSEAAVRTLSDALVAQGKTREAADMLQEASERRPESLGLVESLASVRLRAGNSELAQELVERAARIHAGDSAAQMRLGALETAAGDHAGALEKFRRAQKLSPEALEPRASVATALARLGRFEEAVATARQAQKQFSRNPTAWVLEGDLWRTRGQWPEAIKAYRKALELAPTPALYAPRLHDALVKSGATVEASRTLAGWLAKSPDDERLNLYAGQLAIADRRFSDAAQHYRQVVSADPTNAAAHNNLAWSLHQLKDKGALAAAERAWKLAPGSAAIADTLALVLETEGQAARALTLRERAAQLAPRSAEFRLRYARALKASGDKPATRRELEAITRDFPGTPHASAALQMGAEL